LAITLLLVRDVRESGQANMVMVVVRRSPERPRRHRDWRRDHLLRQHRFDAVSTGSEEARNPGPDLPFAIGSLVICTIFYILTTVDAIGIATPALLGGSEAPLATALEEGARHHVGGVDALPRSTRRPARAGSTPIHRWHEPPRHVASTRTLAGAARRRMPIARSARL